MNIRNLAFRQKGSHLKYQLCTHCSVRTELELARGSHRRRIDLEDNAKVVVSDWGTESLPR